VLKRSCHFVFRIFCIDSADELNETSLRTLRTSLADFIEESRRRRQGQGHPEHLAGYNFKNLKRNGFDPLAIGGRFGKRSFGVAIGRM
jgi:hypothetical protein